MPGYPDPNYQLLRQALAFDVAARWVVDDAKDEFFPDPLGFRDLADRAAEYLATRQHRLLQYDSLQSWKLWVPKKNGMLREAMWLQPIHRILYTACLHYFLPRLDAKVIQGVYSYRVDSSGDPDAYPFANRMERWFSFHNDFREAALEDWAGAVLVTDLASFFDHIDCWQLCVRIETMLGPGISDTDRSVLALLHRLTLMWSNSGYGIPQNCDPSSFFGSLYLHPVDYSMARDRYPYYRWLDDIRVVAKNKKQALRALHDLQRYAQEHGLFLSSAKTFIAEKGSEEFAQLMDVEDDQILSRAVEIQAQGDCLAMREALGELGERLERHQGPEGDDRKFRAFANRILSFGEFDQLAESVNGTIVPLVLPRLESHPDRSDYWAKMLVTDLTPEVLTTVERLLVDDPTVFDWQRFHLWRMLLSLEANEADRFVEAALHSLAREPSEAVVGMATVFVGKHGTNEQREEVFRQSMTPQRSYVVQRASIIAIQEVPEAHRERLFERALAVNGEHRELVAFLAVLETPRYGEIPSRTRRRCREEPREVSVTIERGVGLVRGSKVRFRLSRSDMDYE